MFEWQRRRVEEEKSVEENYIEKKLVCVGKSSLGKKVQKNMSKKTVFKRKASHKKREVEKRNFKMWFNQKIRLSK